MNADEVLRGLRYEQKKRENDVVGTCQTDISLMCKDAVDCIESLQAQLKEEESRRYQAECNYDKWKTDCLKERDAAIEDLKNNWLCAACAERKVGREWSNCPLQKIVDAPEGNCTCSNFEWRCLNT